MSCRTTARTWRRALGFVGAAVALGVTALFATACPGTLADPDDFTGAPADIFAERCATAGCHDAKTHANKLDLTPDEGLRERIVGVASPDCGGKWIDTSKPEASVIYTKCTPMKTCGTQMPQTGEPLSQDELDELLGWIKSIK